MTLSFICGLLDSQLNLLEKITRALWRAYQRTQPSVNFQNDKYRFLGSGRFTSKQDPRGELYICSQGNRQRRAAGTGIPSVTIRVRRRENMPFQRAQKVFTFPPSTPAAKSLSLVAPIKTSIGWHHPCLHKNGRQLANKYGMNKSIVNVTDCTTNGAKILPSIELDALHTVLRILALETAVQQKRKSDKKRQGFPTEFF